MFNNFVGLIVLYVLLATRVQAAVVINEFLPNPSGPSSEDSEWIELYNSGTEIVDLAGWKLDDIDGGGSSPYIIASGSSIPALGYLFFENKDSKIQLNNSYPGDSVRLLDRESIIVDSYSYQSTQEDVSIGRTSDGDGVWVTCTSATKGSANNCSEPSPTATNSPTRTMSPTRTPSVTKTPTSPPQSTVTHTPVSTNTQSPVQDPKPTSTSKPTAARTPTPKKTPTPMSKLGETESGMYVLGESIGSSAPSSTPSTGPRSSPSYTPLIITFLLVGIGLGIIAAVLAWQKHQEMKHNGREEKEEGAQT